MDDKPDPDDPMLAGSDQPPDVVHDLQPPAVGESNLAQDRAVAALKLVSDGPD